MRFGELIQRSRNKGESPFEGTLLSLDPGHTTGWAVFVGTDLAERGQIDTKVLNESTLLNVKQLLETHTPDVVVYEDYRIYKWRAQHHANSDLHTTKLIGMIETLLMTLTHAERYKQGAYVAKQFATDDKLKEWGFYVPGLQHARDAIRHGCYYIAFGTREQYHKRHRKAGTTVG